MQTGEMSSSSQQLAAALPSLGGVTVTMLNPGSYTWEVLLPSTLEDFYPVCLTPFLERESLFYQCLELVTCLLSHFCLFKLLLLHDHGNYSAVKVNDWQKTTAISLSQLGQAARN